MRSTTLCHAYHTHRVTNSEGHSAHRDREREGGREEEREKEREREYIHIHVCKYLHTRTQGGTTNNETILLHEHTSQAHIPCTNSREAYQNRTPMYVCLLMHVFEDVCWRMREGRRGGEGVREKIADVQVVF